MSKRVSVFIPVYRESPFLEPLLDSLVNDPYEDKEIHVVIDEPTDRSIETSRRFSEYVHFIFNGERKGKANVLNELAKHATGDIFLFLDSDVIIKDGDGSFIGAVVEEMEDADIIEIKKNVIRDSFVAKITSYDYLSFSLSNWYISKKIGKCLGINGAAFAIRRETFESLGGFRRVICEDLDIAARSFIRGARFKFVDKIAVSTKAPSTFKEWFNQRKRWGIGTAYWFKEYFNLLKSVVREYPSIVLPVLLFLFPALPPLLTNIFLPDEPFIKMFFISLILLSARTSIFLPPAAFTSTTLSTLRNFLVMIGSLSAYSILFYLIARKFQFCFNPLEFSAFYFVLAPMWLLIIIASIIKVYVKPESVNIDWKV